MIRSRKHNNPTVDMLGRMPLFAGVSRRQLEVLGFFADEALVRPGRDLLRQDEAPRECFILVDGTAEVSVEGCSVATVGATTLIGAQSLLGRTRRASSVTTTEETRLFALGARGFWQLMDIPIVAERVRSAASTVPECILTSPLPLPSPSAPTSARLVAAAR